MDEKYYAPGTRGQAIRFQRGRRYEMFTHEDGSFALFDLGPATADDEAAVKDKFSQVEITTLPFEIPAGCQ